jgi:hypothetical protein
VSPRPPGRSLSAATVLAALVGTALAVPGAASADVGSPDPVGGLRAAVAAGETAYDALPSGTIRRAPRSGMRTQSLTGETPTTAASLTAAPVSNIVVQYVDDTATWTADAKAAFEAAVQVWEHTLESPVDIIVEATAMTFHDPAILGGAGPYDFRRDDRGTRSEADDVFEPVALHNAKRRTDTLPGEPDIVAAFNPGQSGLYFGLDGNPGPDQYDFRSVVLHEIAHGLGLVGTATVDFAGNAQVGSTTVNASGARSGVSFDTFTYATSPTEAGIGGRRVLSMPDGSEELRQALTGDALYWAGQHARTAIGNSPLPLYAPSDFFEGTSYGHLDEGTFPGEHPDGMMTPFLEPGEAIRSVGQVAMGMLADLGFAVPALTGARYTPLDPVRVLDTRKGLGAAGGAVAAGGHVDLKVTGLHGVPTTATAVVLNVTGDRPSAATDVRVYPTPVTASPVPVVSNLNLAAGATRANLVTVPVGHDGRVRLRNSSGAISLIADLAGYYAPSASVGFTAADPVRILDTTTGLGTTRTGPVGPGEVVELVVTGGASPVPSGATAVALTVTATEATAATDIGVFPVAPTAGTPRVSSLNAAPGMPVPNLVVVKVASDGKVRLRNQAGQVRLLADVAGWYDAASSAQLFRPVTPTRVLDTRIGLGLPPGAPTTVGAGEAIAVRVASVAGVPRGAAAAVLNTTGVAATALTDVRVYPATASAPPKVSNLNLVRGQTAADLVMVKLGNQQVLMRNASGSVALVADVAGWFGV